jgi:hypothetical protein
MPIQKLTIGNVSIQSSIDIVYAKYRYASVKRTDSNTRAVLIEIDGYRYRTKLLYVIMNSYNGNRCIGSGKTLTRAWKNAANYVYWYPFAKGRIKDLNSYIDRNRKRLEGGCDYGVKKVLMLENEIRKSEAELEYYKQFEVEHRPWKPALKELKLYPL